MTSYKDDDAIAISNNPKSDDAYNSDKTRYPILTVTFGAGGGEVMGQGDEFEKCAARVFVESRGKKRLLLCYRSKNNQGCL
jgi:hypothetical protein